VFRIDNREHAFEDQFLGLEGFGHSCADAVRGGQQNQVRQRQAINRRDEGCADAMADRLEMGEVAEYSRPFAPCF